MSEWKMDGKPGLVICHMQKGIVGNGYFTGHEWWERGDKAIKESGMIAKQQALLKAFRDKKLPVVFVNVLHNPLGHTPAYGRLWNMIRDPRVDGRKMLESSAIREGLEVIPELNRRPDEPLLINWTVGSFSNSGLDIVLKRQDVKTIVLTGFAAHSVVYNTLVQAADLWYSVIIPRDSTTSPADLRLGYDTVMDIMAPSLALVTTTKDVIAHL